MTPSSQTFYPAALTIAGSDSGGGAGIQADLRAFRCFDVFGCSAITAVTAQNPAEVRRIDALPVEAVQAQIEAVMDTMNIRGIKTGMLFSVPLIRTVSDAIRGKDIPLVADPVMVSTSGAPLLQPEAVQAVIQEIFPAARWITPNIPEAELLLNTEIKSFDDMLKAAKELTAKYHCCTVLKGGHADTDPAARDAVCTEDALYILSSPRLETLPHASHGTGCTFSAAMAAALAKGYPEEQALCLAKAFVYLSLRDARLVSPAGKASFGAMPPVLAGFPSIPEDIRLERI